MVNDLLTRVKGIYQKLRSKVSALKNTLVQRLPSAKEKPKASSSSRSPKASKKK